jgi:hypothetical protein
MVKILKIKKVLLLAIILLSLSLLILPGHHALSATKAAGEGCSNNDECDDFCDKTLPNGTFLGSCNHLDGSTYAVRGIGKSCTGGQICVSCGMCYNDTCINRTDQPKCSPTGYGCNTFENCIGGDVCDVSTTTKELPSFASFYKGTCVDPTTQSAGDETITPDEIQVNFIPQVTIPGSKFQQGESLTLENSTAPIIKYIQAIYNYSISLVGIIGAIMLMMGGLIWITSEGNAEKVGQAKSFIGASVVGILLALTSYILLNAVNPDLTAPRPTAVAPTKEQVIVRVEACNWRIASETTCVSGGTGGGAATTIENPGCSGTTEVQKDGLCENFVPPAATSLQNESSGSCNTTGKKAVCCCNVSNYGIDSQQSGTTVKSLDVDESGVYWCCNAQGGTIEVEHPNTDDTTRLKYVSIQSATKDPVLAKCTEYKNETTFVQDGVTVKFQNDAVTWVNSSSGKCTETYDDTSPLNDQCTGKSNGTICKMTATDLDGTGYCFAGLCKRCLKPGDTCYYNDSEFECPGENGLCGGDHADCNHFSKGDITMCYGKGTTADGKLNIGENCSSNSECTAGSCCLTGSGGNTQWCWPKDIQDPTSNGVTCMTN